MRMSRPELLCGIQMNYFRLQILQIYGLKSGIFFPQIVVVKIAETAGDSRG